MTADLIILGVIVFGVLPVAGSALLDSPGWFGSRLGFGYERSSRTVQDLIGRAPAGLVWRTVGPFIFAADHSTGHRLRLVGFALIPSRYLAAVPAAGDVVNGATR